VGPENVSIAFGRERDMKRFVVQNDYERVYQFDGGKYVLFADAQAELAAKVAELEARGCPSWMAESKTCNESSEVDRMRTRLEELEAVVEFYANPETWKEVGHTVVSGGFDDIDVDTYYTSPAKTDAGSKARAARAAQKEKP
jgi:hypothetical protein